MKATKNICCAKSEGAADHSTITKWFKKFHLEHKNLNNQARLDSLKSMNSKAMLQTQNVSG